MGDLFAVITVEVLGDINTMGRPDNIWEVIRELYLFVYMCASA